MTKKNDLITAGLNELWTLRRDKDFLAPGNRNNSIVNLAISCWVVNDAFNGRPNYMIPAFNYDDEEEFKRVLWNQSCKIYKAVSPNKDRDLMEDKELVEKVDEVIERVVPYMEDWGPDGQRYLAAIYLV